MGREKTRMKSDEDTTNFLGHTWSKMNHKRVKHITCALTNTFPNNGPVLTGILNEAMTDFLKEV